MPGWLRPAILTALGLLLGVSIAVTTCQNLDSPWTSVRLAPTFALVRGYPLYSLPSQPPWVMVGYGPLYPLMYLPCILAREPVTATAMGTILAHLYILVPTALLCFLFRRRLSPAHGRTLDSDALSGLLLFVVLTFLVGSVDSIARHVHVDAPTYGLLLLACYAALRAEGPVPSRAGLGWTLAAGALAGMSLCCKINALGSVGALGLYVWWSAGWRRMLVCAAGVLGTTVLVYGWAAWQSGTAAIAHNFHVLGRFPWYGYQALEFHLTILGETSRALRDKIFSAGFVSLQAVQTYALPFATTALLGYGLSRRARASASGQPTASAYRVIGCLLFVSALGAPASIASVAKYGGEINGWAFVAVPLSVATVLALLGLLDHASRAERFAAHGILAAAALVCLLGAGLIFHKLNPRGGTAMGESFRTIKAHPGECYFPTDPLAHLLAGEPFRPNLDVVYSYWVAGDAIDPAVFKTTMPANLRYVAISKKMQGWGGDEVRRLLPEVDKETDALGLQFHDTLTRP